MRAEAVAELVKLNDHLCAVSWFLGAFRTGPYPSCEGGSLSVMKEPEVRPDVFAAYWHVAAERQRMFEHRIAGLSGPATDDPILAGHRFCNSFRASDRVSQDLIREAYIDALDDDDLFVRVVLHRLFSRPATFRLIERELGRIDAASFDEDRYGNLLDRAMADGQRLYTSAFILCANSAFGHRRKHRNHLALVAAMLADEVPRRLAQAASLEAVYDELLGWPLIGPFMAYQIAIDLNYTALIDFSEDDFTVPGPGAVRGLAKVFVNTSGLTDQEAIHWLVGYQDRVEEATGVAPPTLFGRRLHAIDCQNLLCEVDKYSRVAFPELVSNRSRIKQRYTPDPEPLDLFYPPKWGIDTGLLAGAT